MISGTDIKGKEYPHFSRLQHFFLVPLLQRNENQAVARFVRGQNQADAQLLRGHDNAADPSPGPGSVSWGSKSDMLRFTWSCLIQTEQKMHLHSADDAPSRYCSCLRCPHLDAAPCISIG